LMKMTMTFGKTGVQFAPILFFMPVMNLTPNSALLCTVLRAIAR